MKYSIKIGNRTFCSKKKALEHYKKILNSYEIGDKLKSKDHTDLLALLDLHPRVKEKVGIGIEMIIVSKLKKFNSRSFELIRIDGSTEYFSYLKPINATQNDISKFRQACRQVIQDDLTQVKQNYFKKYSKNGKVKCQETNEPTKYVELHLDHRQPNTFSVIVDRFIELNNIDLKSVTYTIINGAPNKFESIDLGSQFKEYHKEKANLHLVKKSLNLSRSNWAKTNRQKKDLKIE